MVTATRWRLITILPRNWQPTPDGSPPLVRRVEDEPSQDRAGAGVALRANRSQRKARGEVPKPAG